MEFQIKSGQPVAADLRNGELFKGTQLSYFERTTSRIDVTMAGETAAITGRMGDRPAIQLPAPTQDGLMILAHEAMPAVITYQDWAKFIKFAAHKDFSEAEAIHTARGWEKTGFEETYTRHSKSLIAVGSGEGADRALGLATEFVALDNPYAWSFDGVLDVELLYNGAPRTDAQIEVYTRDAQDMVEVATVRTDDTGRAAIPVEAGMEYLLDAVVLRPVANTTTVAEGPVWETLWASMTFAVPER